MQIKYFFGVDLKIKKNYTNENSACLLREREPQVDSVSVEPDAGHDPMTLRS